MTAHSLKKLFSNFQRLTETPSFFQLTLDKKLIQCIVFINYDVIYYEIFLKRVSQAFVFTYISVSVCSILAQEQFLGVQFQEIYVHFS